MKIVIAVNAFKGCMNSISVANCIEKVAKNYAKEIVKLPLADGGDGTIEVFNYYFHSKIEYKEVTSPIFNKKVFAPYLILKDGTVVIELAKIAGISLLKKEERKPLYTTTYGVGEMIKYLVESGYKKVILGVGGSATVDAGCGILSALGVKFINKDKKSFIPTGKTLNEIKEIDLSNKIKIDKLLILCDVNNPLLNDGVEIYLKQKGANKEDIRIIIEGMKNFIQFVNIDKNKECMGAAGGVPFGLSLLDCEIYLGAKYIMEIIKFEEKVKDADILITGEGEINENTCYGKVVKEVGNFGKLYKIPVVAIAGKLGNGAEKLYAEGVTSMFSIIDKPMHKIDAIKNAKKLIEKTIKNILNIVNI